MQKGTNNPNGAVNMNYPQLEPNTPDTYSPNPFDTPEEPPKPKAATQVDELNQFVQIQSLNKKRIQEYSNQLSQLNKQIEVFKANKTDPIYQIALEQKMQILSQYQILVEEQELLAQQIELLKNQKLKEEQKKRDRVGAGGKSRGKSRSGPSQQNTAQEIKRLQADVKRMKAHEANLTEIEKLERGGVFSRAFARRKRRRQRFANALFHGTDNASDCSLI